MHSYETFQQQLSWERYFWITMKGYIINYPEFPTKSIKKNIHNLFINSAFLIPHEMFKKYYLEYIENISVINFLDNRKYMMQYLYDMYIYIFNKCKNEYKVIVSIENNKNYEPLYHETPYTFQEFWDDYTDIYKIIKHFNIENYKTIRILLFTIVILYLLYLVFKYYNLYENSLGGISAYNKIII